MAPKQGAYGLVPTHSHSLLSQLAHPREVFALVRLGMGRVLEAAARATTSGQPPPPPQGKEQEQQQRPGGTRLVGELAVLWEHLNRTSRSFAVVIRVLPAEAADAVCVFYLLLRALDTIEDEMDLDKFRELQDKDGDKTLMDTKARLVREFWRILPGGNNNNNNSSSNRATTAYPLSGVLHSRIGKDSEHELVVAIPLLVRAFTECLANASCQDAILHVVREMGEGMAEYASRDMSRGTTDTADYDRYCHFVAGTVGYGLTRLFDATSLEENASELVKDQSLWDGMGMFLQRTNIIRDVCEDAAEGRAFWPVTVWRRPGVVGESIANVRDLRILNEMVAHALELVPVVVRYLERLHHPSVLRFCALPQVMALHTLSACYNNELVFTGVVKIRSGCAASIVLSLDNTDTDMIREGYVYEMTKALVSMRSRARAVGDVNTVSQCNHGLAALGHPPERTEMGELVETSLGVLFVCAVLLLWWHFSLTGRSTALADMFARGDEALGQAFAMALASFTLGAMVFSASMAVGGGGGRA